MKTIPLNWYLRLMVVFCFTCNAIFSQFYQYTYVCNSKDTLFGVDTVTNITKVVFPIAGYSERNYVKSGQYGGLIITNKWNSIFDMASCNSGFVLYDFVKLLAWKSRDSSFHKIEYALPKKTTPLMGSKIRYDLGPGVYIIADKNLPSWLCPDIFITGLQYGVSKMVVGNAIVELKNYTVVNAVPLELQKADGIFKDALATGVTATYPSFPKKGNKICKLIKYVAGSK